jgi:gamma-glutamyltranspeptidase/glutathione hydrolase
MAIDIPGEDPVVIDGYMAYPGRGFLGEPYLREITMPYGGGVTTLVDAGSIAVPGGFAALEMASEMFGAIPWQILAETVADALEDGFPLSPACHLYLNDGAAPIFASDPVARKALLDGEASHPLGSQIIFPGLTDTLRYIGGQGAGVFYRGDLAQAIVDDLADRGGQLTGEDMESYRAKARKPLAGSLRGWRLAMNPAPAVGGVMVARTLDLVDRPDDAGLARALISAFRERRDATFRSSSTISVAAADSQGGVVAASYSAGYGSGVIPKGTGMLMNNSVGELELLSGTGTPGERMTSNMAPTVARRGGDAVAIGSPGADRITTAVATTLIGLSEGESLRAAIDHPRIHPEFGDFGVRVAAEPGLDLTQAGVDVREFEGLHMYFGGVNGAGFLDDDLHAYADPRRTGSVAFTG